MKALISVICIAVLVGGIYLLSSSGCNAQRQVAQDKIMERINNWLGDLDVKRKEISNEITKLEAAIENVRQQRVQSEVQLEQYQAKIEPVKKQIDRIKQALAMFQPHIKAIEDVQINNRTFSPAEIQENVNTLIEEYESLNRQLGGYEVSIKAFEQSHELLARQENSAKGSMKLLKEKLDEIDVKKEALESMRSAQTIVGEGGSISDEFEKLEKQINDLFVEVEAGMRVESEKIAERERDLASSTTAVDEILDEMETKDATAARLEEILGTSGAPDTGDDGAADDKNAPDDAGGNTPPDDAGGNTPPDDDGGSTPPADDGGGDGGAR
jgi:chromosome segregation ATPase